MPIVQEASKMDTDRVPCHGFQVEPVLKSLGGRMALVQESRYLQVLHTVTWGILTVCYYHNLEVWGMTNCDNLSSKTWSNISKYSLIPPFLRCSLWTSVVPIIYVSGPPFILSIQVYMTLYMKCNRPCSVQQPHGSHYYVIILVFWHQNLYSFEVLRQSARPKSKCCRLGMRYYSILVGYAIFVQWYDNLDVSFHMCCILCNVKYNGTVFTSSMYISCHAY